MSAKKRDEEGTTSLVQASSTDLAVDDDYAEQFTGHEIPDREEDRIQSWVKVLHQLSPELNSRDPSYINKAKPGDIWIAAQNLLIPGDVGFKFQVCGTQYNWVEWPGAPGSGGRPVARYPKKPIDMGGDSTVFGRIDLPNGHQIIETRYFMGLVYANGSPAFPATISFSSTGSPIAQNWIQKIRAHRTKNGNLAPQYMYLWPMVTIEQSNDRGRWYLLSPVNQAEVRASREQFDVAREIHDKIVEQQLKLGDDEGVNASIDQIPF